MLQIMRYVQIHCVAYQCYYLERGKNVTVSIFYFVNNEPSVKLFNYPYNDFILASWLRLSVHVLGLCF